MTEKELKFKIHQLEKEVEDLKVVINTCQTALRSVDFYFKDDEKKHSEIFTHSAKWAMNYQL
jgi:lipid A disaccharide synthetase